MEREHWPDKGYCYLFVSKNENTHTKISRSGMIWKNAAMLIPEEKKDP